LVGSSLSGKKGVEEIGPALNRFWVVINLHTVDDACWSSTDAVGSGILPVFSGSPVSIVLVVSGLDVLDIFKWKASGGDSHWCPLEVPEVNLAGLAIFDSPFEILPRHLGIGLN
jgi:hypothetical protein